MVSVNIYFFFVHSDSLLRSALTEMSVLLDVLNIAKKGNFMVLDTVSTEAPEPRPAFTAIAKKRVTHENSL